ncbi:hypothetical protein QJS04_geneDACA023683 [Acorus gramineus]|uniref:DDE Tnp4 domain-containing protein n=1 Tax=Acorus gramineus TaxID=55184 RepID=A0AAV9B4E4_ACOGR|nr:hypothetical protein QJS04_geneDACA023472 [Acorus gramineus]KAK1271635.1 hypothetical protein QJS04_geneDACA023683 [Acorus gramineus]
MGPIRGSRKRRRPANKKVERSSASSSPEEEESGEWWHDFSNRISGPLSSSRDTEKFESVFKISRKTFDYICSLVKEDMVAKPSNFTTTGGKVLSVNDQVAVALRRLISGKSFVSLGVSFGMNKSTVSQITWRFVEAMEERGLHHLRWPSTETEMQNIKSKFEKIRGLPNCCGVIDTTHIMMCMPSDPANDIYLDQEKKHSMVLQAIVDPDMRFRDIVTGWPGSMCEPLVLKNSGFSKLCERGHRLNGASIDLSEASKVREYIVGDAGYPLLPWLITPYQGKGISVVESEFNKRHFATRMVAQRALVKLKDMWRIVQGEMWRPDKHRLPRIILVCCLLHNILIDMEDIVQDEMALSHLHDSGYKQQVCKASDDDDGAVLRDTLRRYLTGRLTS